jgi:hypothetical protein
MVYVCAHYGTGGKDYEKKHPGWSRKVPSKATDCPCSLKIKKYHNTSVILGKYHRNHNHPIGADNLRFTRISDATRDWIAGMVRMKVKSNHIVSNVRRALIRIKLLRNPVSAETPHSKSLLLWKPCFSSVEVRKSHELRPQRISISNITNTSMSLHTPIVPLPHA